MAGEVLDIAPVSPDAPPVAADAPVAAAPADSVVETAPEPVVEAPVEATAEPVAEPVVESAPEDAKEPVVETAPEPVLPTYEPFTLPEGLQAAPEQLQAFSGLAGKHGLSQEAAQEFMDMHASALQGAQTAMDQRQRDVFSQTRRDFREDFYKSAGNRADTLANDAKFAIAQLVPDKKARAEVFSLLDYTGTGDHKAMIGMLAAAGKKLRERAAPPPPVPPKGAPERAADRRYAPRT